MSRASLLMAIVCAFGVFACILVGRHQQAKVRPVDGAAAAAAAVHTIPLEPAGRS